MRYPIIALVLLSLVPNLPQDVAAQDATPATPTIVSLAGGGCVPPPAPASALASDAATPGASTVTGAEAGATPGTRSARAGVPAEPELVERVMVAEQTLLNCLNAGDYDVVIAWHTPTALVRLFGTTDPDDAAALLEGFPLTELEAVENVRVLEDGRIAADVRFTVGGEPMRSRDFWVEHDGILYFDDVEALPMVDATPTS